jgi:hypothetical protein
MILSEPRKVDASYRSIPLASDRLGFLWIWDLDLGIWDLGFGI